MNLSKFISQAEAIALVESGLVEELRLRAAKKREQERQRLAEEGYQKAMRDYGVSREQVNPLWVQNEYVNYHTHGGFPQGGKGVKMANLIEAYANGELCVNYRAGDTEKGVLIPLTQDYMETNAYSTDRVWNVRQQGEHIGPDYVAFGYFGDLCRASIAKMAEDYCLWGLNAIHEVEFSPHRSAEGSRAEGRCGSTRWALRSFRR
jgi:hypothetical protein